jgi:hypothetical protein
LIGGDVMAAEMEEVVDRVVRREEPLCLSWRFEPLHLSLASSRRLMRILSPVVKPLMPAMLDAATVLGLVVTYLAPPATRFCRAMGAPHFDSRAAG